MSADGRWVAFESAEGNLNFAKRYGEMNVFVRDLRHGRIYNVSDPLGVPGTRSAYNPSLSGDGRLVAYETYEQGAATDTAGDVVVRDVRTGRARTIQPPPGAGDASEPELSRDGRRLAFTSLVGDRSEVFVQDLATGRTRLASPATRRGNRRCRRTASVVAYTAAGAGRASNVVVRDLRTNSARVLGSPAGRGLAYRAVALGDGSARGLRRPPARAAAHAGVGGRRGLGFRAAGLARRRTGWRARHGSTTPPGDLGRRPARGVHLRRVEPRRRRSATRRAGCSSATWRAGAPGS